MKHLLNILFFLAMICHCQGQNYADNGFTNKTEAKNLLNDTLKIGKWIEYIGDSDKIIEDSNDAFFYRLIIYKAGKPEGIVRWYYSMSGKLYRIVPYTNGVKNGMEKWYFENGKLQWDLPWTYGKLSGIEKIYYPNEQLKWEIPFINDSVNGLQKYFYENGALHETATYKNNKLNGISKRYYESGTLMSVFNFSNDSADGLGRNYYESGKLKTVANFKNGLLHGKTKKYYESGVLKEKEFYHNDKKNGLKKSYYSNGKIYFKTLYSNGRKNGIEKDYYYNGKLKGEYTFFEGNLNGIEKEYYPSGKLETLIVFRNDTADSISNYNENGDIVRLKTGWYYVSDSGLGYKMKLYGMNELYSINPNPIVTAKDFTTIDLGKSNVGDFYLLTIHFNNSATKAWSVATGNSITKKLAFILDGTLLSTPTVQAQIKAGISALSRGDITKKELEKIKSILISEE